MEKERIKYESPWTSQRRVMVETFMAIGSPVAKPIHSTKSTIQINEQEGFDAYEGVFNVNTWNN